MASTQEALQNAVGLHQAGEHAQASALYQEILTVEPDNSDALHLLGVLSHQSGDHERAIDYISKAIAVHDVAASYHSNLGTSFRALGRNREAISSFRTAIQHDASFAGAHYNLGIALAAENQIEAAIASFEDALRVDPDFLDVHNNLGRMYSIQHRYEQAIQHFQIVLDAVPHVPKIHYNLANALHGNGEWDKAISSYEKAIELSPKFYNAINNLGSIYKDQGQLEKAIDLFEQALAIKSDFDDAKNNLNACRKIQEMQSQPVSGLPTPASDHPLAESSQLARVRSLQQTGQLDEATQLCQQLLAEALTIDADVTYCLGEICLSQGKTADAVTSFEQTIAANPGHINALAQLGKLRLDEERLSEAADCFQKIVTLEPTNAIAHYNLGNVRKEELKWNEAINSYRTALKHDPEFVKAHINLGIVLGRQQKLAEALDCHRRAVDLRPDDAEAVFYLAQAELISGDLRNGFEHYEWRWKYENNARNVAGTAWSGTSLDEQRLFVYSEQGVGDEVMFASCLPEVLRQTNECWLECDPRLVSLFRRSFPLAHVVPRPYTEQAQLTSTPLPYDQQIALGSLPRYLRPTIESFPIQRRYLAADAEKIQLWRERYAELGNGLAIGISWRGGKPGSSRRNRSQALEQWKDVLTLPGVQWINLQYGDHGDEVSQVSRDLGIAIHEWDDSDPLKDLDNLAAQIAALDLVISVDNATVHFAGALGIPCWALIPYAPNWRWMLERNDTPWYASVLLYRQEQPGEWSSTFTHVADNLRPILRAPETALPSSPATNPQNNSTQPTEAVAAGFRPSLAAAQFVRPADTNSSVVTKDEDRNVTEQPVSETAEIEVDHEAAREKKKYEHIWTHGAYREYSPGLHDMDKLPLLEFLRRFEVKTILDAGCGSGKLMQRLLTEHRDEFDVHGFDISENCLDPFFDDIKSEILTVGCLWDSGDFCKQYDAVICTDVMEHIPTEQVPAVLNNFRHCTNKMAYLAIALFPDNFGPKLLGEPLHLTVKEPEWWFDSFRQAKFTLDAYAVEKHETGRDMWLHAFLTPS